MRSSIRARLLGLAATAAALLGPAPARAFSPFLVTPDPAVAEASAAYRYANMTDAAAMAELDRRQIIYTVVPAAAAPGVRAPIRITARLHGVWFHSSLPPDARVVSPFEILDARLALSLDDFAALLERHDIDEVVHFTMYRPNAGAPPHGVDDEGPPRAQAAPSKGAIGVAKGEHAPGGGVKQKTPETPVAKQEIVITHAPKKPAGKLGSAVSSGRPGAPRAVAMKAPQATRRPIPPPAPPSIGSGLHQTTWAAPGTRHPAGLAIDVGMVHKRDGRWINVGVSFRGKIGAKTCGEGALPAEDPDARELRSLVCESSDLGLFTYVLTPNYNAAHADHFHMEIKPGVRWFLYH